MKKYVFKILVILIVSFVQACETPEEALFVENQSIVSDQKDEKGDKSDSISDVPYEKNKLIVIYKKAPTDPTRAFIQGKIQDLVPAARDIKVYKQCDNCEDAYMELWTGEDIHTFIHAEAIRSGTSGTSTKGVGDDSLAYYSLNFISQTPQEPFEYKSDYFKSPNSKEVRNNIAGKDKIVVAVLDTGLDTTLINNSFLWNNMSEIEGGSDVDGNCYPGDKYGWNFTDYNSDFHEDNKGLHGTFVTKYIINEFKNSPDNYVQIMSLKTHNAHGYGKLFDIICAIHYARKNGANIINASWGFYYYQDKFHPYLDRLITEQLKKEGILFFAAAGNKLDSVDASAVARGRVSSGNLRQLHYHHFYPACLSDRFNNVFTVTTIRGSRVSPNQNYSNQYVDFGIWADRINTDGSRFEFKVPFEDNIHYSDFYISGSSFATPIAAGKVGAFFPKLHYQYMQDYPKLWVMNTLLNTRVGPYSTRILYYHNYLRGQIKDGKIMLKE